MDVGQSYLGSMLLSSNQSLSIAMSIQISLIHVSDELECGGNGRNLSAMQNNLQLRVTR